MNNKVTLVECPRDAWQALPLHIPAEIKAGYLQQLIDSGFNHIDAVSFVSASAVPQMADSEAVLKLLDVPEGVEIIGIVVNAKGAERAVNTAAVQTLGFPYSISPEFLRRNQNQSPEEAVEVLTNLAVLSARAKLGLVVYVSMAFGNPYGDAWDINVLIDACHRLRDAGIRQISLADTVGLASPPQIRDNVAAVLGKNLDVEFGVHLHSRPQDAAEKIQAAFQAGCRRFDTAAGGLGGCPFAQDVLVGNIPTEICMRELGRLGAQVPDLAVLPLVVESSAKIAEVYGASGD